MFVFNTNSWHFKLVMYVFGDSFFSTRELDMDATIKKIEFKPAKRLDWNNNEDNKLVKAEVEPDCFVYKSIPKIVNLCPYCRTVVAAIPLLPFAFVAKRIPKREKKPFDIKKSRRNTKIIKIVAMAVMSLFGVHQLIVGNYGVAAFHFGIASFQIWGKYVFEAYAKWYEKRAEKKLKDHKPEDEDTQKNPSLFLTYLKSNHSKVCPPIAFVDKNDTEIRR